jgi:serine/threonine protein kinase
MLAVGATVGKWRVVGLLGKGGMAEVYEVEDVALGAHYALKLFTYARGEIAAVKTRFFAEGRLLAKLDHPRLVRVYDIGEDAGTGRPYFVMDIVLSPDGRPKTLADADVGGVDEDQVAIWYEDLRDGLSYIHGKGILHRDLKLQNVMIGPDGHVVLSDFGLAKIFNPDLRTDVGLTLEQTIMAVKGGQKMVMGSVGYMAPEVEMGVPASKESDWYALGVIIFRLLTGIWCDSRTDVVADLETYNPIWRDILPKLLHANPAGRECPDWRVLEKARRDAEAYRVDTELEYLRRKRHDAVRGRRNGWVAATLTAAASAALVFFIMQGNMGQPSASSLDFDSMVRIPENAPDEEPDEDGGMPSRGQFEIARIDAWVLTHDIFADLKSGKIARDKAIDELRQLAKRADDDDLSLFDINNSAYTQVGESAPLAYLLHSAASNLVNGVQE